MEMKDFKQLTKEFEDAQFAHYLAAVKVVETLRAEVVLSHLELPGSLNAALLEERVASLAEQSAFDDMDKCFNIECDMSSLPFGED